MATSISTPDRPPVNWLAIGAVVLLHMPLAAGWYNVLAEPWLAAVGKSTADFADLPPTVYLVPVAAVAMTTWLLARLMLLEGKTTVTGGIRWALLLWAGVLLPYIAAHNALAAFPPSLTLIDAGLELVGLLLAGIVLGAWPAASKARRGARILREETAR